MSRKTFPLIAVLLLFGLLLVACGGLLTYVAYEEMVNLYVLSVLMFMGVNVILSWRTSDGNQAKRGIARRS